jgi:hypothetical protein
MGNSEMKARARAAKIYEWLESTSDEENKEDSE